LSENETDHAVMRSNDGFRKASTQPTAHIGFAILRGRVGEAFRRGAYFAVGRFGLQSGSRAHPLCGLNHRSAEPRWQPSSFLWLFLRSATAR